MVSVSFYVNFQKAVHVQKVFAFQTARSYFEQIQTTREWNALHGGVYVPITDETKPNPHLKTQGREIVVNDTLTFTKINPAFMTRQISEIASLKQGIQFHITSLKPIRPENHPTKIEKNALMEFEKGIPEVGKFVQTGIGTQFFFMAPLITQESCLKCHATQGYKAGEIRGGISVTLPSVPKVEITPLISGHIALGLVGLVGIFIFGFKLKEAYETIENQARLDFLTQIPNRLSFSEVISTEFKRSRRDNNCLSVIMCDIDHFKLYNDTFGHAAGDDCLKKVARIIETSKKRPGDFCARYGGEEFVVILPDTSKKGALFVAQRIRTTMEALKMPNPKSEPLKMVTLSLGVATLESNRILTFEELISQADSALYSAKETGRNSVVVFDLHQHRK